MILRGLDAHLFARYVGDGEIRHVVHAHPFILLERVLPWMLFGVVAVQFFYAYDSFGLRSIASPLVIELWFIGVYFALIWMIFLWYTHVWVIMDREVLILQFNGISFDEQYLSSDSIVSVSSANERLYDPIIRRGIIRIHTQDSNLDPIYVGVWDPDRAAEVIRSLLGGEGHTLHGIHTLKPKSLSTSEHPMSDQEAFSLLLRTLTDVVKERTHPREDAIEYRVGDDKPRHKHFVETALQRVDTIDLRPKDEHVGGEHDESDHDHLHSGDPPGEHHYVH